MYIGFYVKFLYYSNKFVNIVNLNIHILITYNHVKTHVCCVWKSFKIKTIIIIIKWDDMEINSTEMQCIKPWGGDVYLYIRVIMPTNLF